MDNETKAYPLRECEDCLHNEVCKHIEVLSNTKESGMLPIDLDNAACDHYLSESVIDGGFYDEDEEGIETISGTSVAAVIKKMVDKAIAEGYHPADIVMSHFTNRVLANEMNCGPGVLVSKLSINDLVLPVFIDDQIGDMVVKVGYEEDDDSVD